MIPFALDERIEASSFAFGRFELCQVRIMNDRRFPWLLLIPERPALREIHDLGSDLRAVLIEEVAAASRALQTVTGAAKINIGALGNIVPQLHIHVIARADKDLAWPGPVWGQGVAVPYDRTEADDFSARLKAGFSALPQNRHSCRY